jgi:hypothetical protein
MAGQEAIQNFGLTQAKIGAEQASASRFQAQADTDKLNQVQKTIELEAIEGRASLLQTRNPDLTPEQAFAIASDPVAFREMVKENPEATQVVETQQGQILIKKRTGETIANLGASPDRSSKVNVFPADKRAELITEKIDIPILNKLSESATASRNLARDSRTIAKLLENTEGGQLVKVTTRLAKDLGLQNESIAANDLANALATRGAVNIRAVGSGSTSDLEFKAYLEAFPSIANSPGGRELMAKYAEKFAERQEKLADKSRELIRNGQFSQGALNAYDESLGSVLGDDFYKGAAPKVKVNSKTDVLMKKYNKENKGKK